MRGRFTPGANDEEWCDRRLLARIHHYTMRRLRAEIEPVAARDFLRFLFAWQRLTPETRLEGPDASPLRSALLEGFEAPAGAWETELLPARIQGYEPAWLDDMAGRIAWARLTPTSKASASRPHHADHAARAPARRVLDLADAAPEDAQPGPRRRPCSMRFARTARCSSRSWSKRPACCASRWRKRSANWSR